MSFAIRGACGPALRFPVIPVLRIFPAAEGR